jgi:hypothetical protein
MSQHPVSCSMHCKQILFVSSDPILLYLATFLQLLLLSPNTTSSTVRWRGTKISHSLLAKVFLPLNKFSSHFCHNVQNGALAKLNRLISTPAKAPPLTRIIRVPLCTADLSPLTRVRAFFLFYVERGGGLIFLMPRLATTV